MLYGVVIGVFVAICAHAAHSLGRIAALPLRWTWIGAMMMTVALIIVAPLRGTGSAPLRRTFASPTLSEKPSSVSVQPAWLAIPRKAFNFVREAVVTPIDRAISVGGRRLPARLSYYLLPIWICVSSLLLLAILIVHDRFARARRCWPATILHGVRVRVSPDVGPAVIGLICPEITVPRWLIGRDTGEQHLVLSHEGEHLRARDPLLLAAAWITAVLIPWNPAVWWMLSRVRLAIELDCDARVLRSGVAPQAYGAVLIDLAEQCSIFRIGAPALADDSSQLRQRLIAMKPDMPRFPRVRAFTISTIALASLLIACETSLPTEAEVMRMNVSSAEIGANNVAILKSRDSATVYTVDGAVVTSNAAHALPSDKITAVEVIKPSGGQLAQVRISTVKGPTLPRGNLTSKTNTPAQSVPTPAVNFSGLYLIDGAHADASAVMALKPNDIVSVEVVKQPLAATRYTDPLAANGVIAITTRSKDKR